LVNLGISSPFPADAIVEPAVLRRIPLDADVDGDVEVFLGGEKFRLSAPARRTLDLLLQRHECRVADISSLLGPHFTETDVDRALEELASHGIVGIRV
jgi:hypothetical protein